MKHPIEVLSLSHEELSLLNRCGITLEVESHAWILQEHWKIRLIQANQIKNMITGPKWYCLQQLRVILSAIKYGIEQGSVPKEQLSTTVETYLSMDLCSGLPDPAEELTAEPFNSPIHQQQEEEKSEDTEDLFSDTEDLFSDDTEDLFSDLFSGPKPQKLAD